MWSNHDKSNDNHNNIPAREFYTPPASWKSSAHSPAMPVMPMSERKISNCKRDLFHVVHKVPSGDSPYVRAKHVQLIDKDPSKAISLFWAAINAGDRVDSALKDMALVMKQLDRSDEAIEAIKSFRHLCAYDSQESLDNVLVELYKRSGRIEEEIDMLHRKLKKIEDGIAFGGKKTKTARSQGKKVQITVEQEKSRILGNLAWAYLQHHDYGLAEQHYRKALALEPDFNKQCNLALCLMHMKRIPEAKSVLQAVSRSSHGSKEMDESYAKSFERAVEMLNELDSHSLLKPTEADENQRSMASPCPRRWENNKENKGPSVPEKSNNCENRGNFFEHRKVDGDWRKGHCFDHPAPRPGFACKKKDNGIGDSQKQVGFGRREMLDSSPAAVLYTQPRRRDGIFSESGQRKARWEDNAIDRPPSRNLLAHAIHKLPVNLHESGSALSRSPSCLVSASETNYWRGRQQTEVDQVNSTRIEGHKSRWRIYTSENGDQVKSKKEEDRTMFVEEFEEPMHNKVKSTDSVKNNCIGSKSSAKPASKSWADMVEEDENKLLTGEDLSPYFDNCWNYEEDENLDSNLLHKSPIESISQKLETFDLKHGSDTFSNSGSPRNPTVRRSLCFDTNKDSPAKKKNRLQVFRDITPNPDSP